MLKLLALETFMYWRANLSFEVSYALRYYFTSNFQLMMIACEYAFQSFLSAQKW